MTMRRGGWRVNKNSVFVQRCHVMRGRSMVVGAGGSSLGYDDGGSGGEDDDDMETTMTTPPRANSPVVDIHTKSDYVEYCNGMFGMQGLVDFGLVNVADEDVEDGLPVVRLRHPKGSSVDVCLHGAAVTSWKRRDGSDMLYVKMSNRFDGEEPVRGGITLAWPQLGSGVLPHGNGILQHMHWSVVKTTAWEDAEDPRPSVSLYTDIEDVANSGLDYDHPFEVLLTITLGLDGEDVEKRKREKLAAEEREEAAKAAEKAEADEKAKKKSASNRSTSDSDLDEMMQQRQQQEEEEPTYELVYQVRVLNKSTDAALSFTTGVTAHLATENIKENKEVVKVQGLLGKYVLDYGDDPMRPSLSIENNDSVRFDPESGENMEKLYVDCPKDGEVLFCPGTQRHFDVRNMEGFKDILVTHPAGTDPLESCRFVGVSAARKARPVQLEPGAAWDAEMKISAFDRYWNISPYEMDTAPSGIPAPPREEALPPRPAAETS